MDVILLEKVRNLGGLGEKVAVRAGYGRNYLIPYGKAVPATSDNIAKFEERRAELEKKALEGLHDAESRAQELSKLTITIKMNASDEGKLYGSVGPFEIARAIKEAGHPVEKKEVIMPLGSIHNVGVYTIELQLHSDVVASVQLEVEPA